MARCKNAGFIVAVVIVVERASVCGELSTWSALYCTCPGDVQQARCGASASFSPRQTCRADCSNCAWPVEERTHEATKMSLRHAGSRFPYRYPPADGLLEKAIGGVGSLCRAVGAALDEFGYMIQASSGVKETASPNLAWAPTALHPDSPPSKGIAAPMPHLRKAMDLKGIVMPLKGQDVFIAPSANVLGDVKIGAKSSIWYGAVLRGDMSSIEVGENTNIQDNAVIQVTNGAEGKPAPTSIGSNVTVGHCATIISAVIGDSCLIGMGSSVLEGAKVGSGSIVAAGAVVQPGTVIPSGQVWAGNPAKLLREVEAEEKDFITASACNYKQLADVHRFENGKTFEELVVESRIEIDRHYASDPINTIHQMYELDAQTLLVTKSKK